MYVKAIVLYKKVLFVIGENLLFYKEETIPNNILIHTMHIGQEFQKNMGPK